MINDKYYKRRFVISGIAILVVVVFLVRLFMLQIVDTSTKEGADRNALVKQPIYPSRGLIYDRNGKLLVYNQPIYEVSLVMSELGKQFDTLDFCSTLQITKQEFDERIVEIKDRKKNRGYSNYTPQIFISQLSVQDIAPLQESLHKFDGVYIHKRTLRDYSYKSAAHVLGSVGEVSQDDIDKDSYYSRGDYSGRDGIEKTYEEKLRGEKGVEVLMRDSKGRIQGSYHEGELDRTPKAGENLTLTLDIELQNLAEELLHGKVGSIVAIEPSTGEVLALASSPTWDPSLLVGRQRSANYKMLANDPHKPLMNRATQAQYPPGSTFKTLQTLVCLQEKGITLRSCYPCSGSSSQPIKCTHHHGSPVNLEGAIEQSCNPYYWQAFRDMLEKDGYGSGNTKFRKRYEIWREDMLSFGLGQKFSDTDISSQASGSIPQTKYFDKYYGKTGWKAMTIRSLSIGQGEILVTPLQLANQAATIANKGYFITPHLNKTDSMKSHIHHPNVDSVYYDVLQRGMHRVMQYGTGRYYNVDSLQMCGKTGTAQNAHGKDHSIYIGFAPLDNPKIAVAAIIENGGFGATFAVPMGTLIMEQYLIGKIERVELKERMASTILIKGKE